jgi:GNAT superfamily N-acetyltransferase
MSAWPRPRVRGASAGPGGRGSRRDPGAKVLVRPARAVLPTERRRGIALRLVAEAEHRLTGKGAIRISALVMSAHDPAVALWLAAGYARDTRVGRFVRSLR